MSRERDFDSTDRRSVLKATAGLATAGLSGLASAREDGKPELERIVDAAHRILERTGDQERYMEFLDNRASTGWVSRSYTIEKESADDGPSTRKIDRTDLDITIGIVNDCWSNPSKYYVELSWHYDGGVCELPDDYTGLMWNRNWWDLYYPDSYDNSFVTSDYVTYQDGTFEGDGPGFAVEDVWAESESSNWSGVYITPIGDYSQTQRRVFGRYSHTWYDVTVQSVSVGFSASGPSFSVEVSDETKEWVTDSEKDGSTPLYVYQSDAC